MQSHRFIKGINYWPASKAMYWWKSFDLQEVEEDFRDLRCCHLNLVRIFLSWEDFQPQPDRISRTMLDKLIRLSDLADSLDMQLMPTYFCGHMSGVNWIPEWMLEFATTVQRFPIYANGRLQLASIRNYYIDEAMLEAQLLQVRKISEALAGHPAIFAYDLGNESSNCVVPPNRIKAQNWLKQVCQEIRSASPVSLITLGMHAEDLEEDHHLWPQDAALFCDFLCMHGYPFYLPWVEDPHDYQLLPFLGIITRWLGGKEVLFQEFGAPTQSKILLVDQSIRSASSCHLWTEDEQAKYFQQALPALQEAGMLGAMAWCFADYQTSLWNQPPLLDNPHERHFGLYRTDGSAKMAVPIWHDFVAEISPEHALQPNQNHPEWLKDFYPDQFYDHPRENLAMLFSLYKESLERK